MKEFSVHLELRQERTVEVSAETRGNAVLEALAQYPGFRAVSVEAGGEASDLVGPCEVCDEHIFDDEYFEEDSEGVCVCKKCLGSELQPNA